MVIRLTYNFSCDTIKLSHLSYRKSDLGNVNTLKLISDRFLAEMVDIPIVEHSVELNIPIKESEEQGKSTTQFAGNRQGASHSPTSKLEDKYFICPVGRFAGFVEHLNFSFPKLEEKWGEDINDNSDSLRRFETSIAEEISCYPSLRINPDNRSFTAPLIHKVPECSYYLIFNEAYNKGVDVNNYPTIPFEYILVEYARAINAQYSNSFSDSSLKSKVVTVLVHIGWEDVIIVIVDHNRDVSVFNKIDHKGGDIIDWLSCSRSLMVSLPDSLLQLSENLSIYSDTYKCDFKNILVNFINDKIKFIEFCNPGVIDNVQYIVSSDIYSRGKSVEGIVSMFGYFDGVLKFNNISYISPADILDALSELSAGAVRFTKVTPQKDIKHPLSFFGIKYKIFPDKSPNKPSASAKVIVENSRQISYVSFYEMLKANGGWLSVLFAFSLILLVKAYMSGNQYHFFLKVRSTHISMLVDNIQSTPVENTLQGIIWAEFFHSLGLITKENIKIDQVTFGTTVGNNKSSTFTPLFITGRILPKGDQPSASRADLDEFFNNMVNHFKDNNKFKLGEVSPKVIDLAGRAIYFKINTSLGYQ